MKKVAVIGSGDNKADLISKLKDAEDLDIITVPEETQKELDRFMIGRDVYTDEVFELHNPYAGLEDISLVNKPLKRGYWASVRTEPKIHRNSSCPCGSGKKFKKCCYGKQLSE